MDSAREAAAKRSWLSRGYDRTHVEFASGYHDGFEDGWGAAKAEASAATADAERCSCGLALGHGSPTAEIAVTEDEALLSRLRECCAYLSESLAVEPAAPLPDCVLALTRKTLQDADAALRKRRERA